MEKSGKSPPITLRRCLRGKKSAGGENSALPVFIDDVILFYSEFYGEIDRKQHKRSVFEAGACLFLEGCIFQPSIKFCIGVGVALTRHRYNAVKISLMFHQRFTQAEEGGITLESICSVPG